VSSNEIQKEDINALVLELSNLQSYAEVLRQQMELSTTAIMELTISKSSLEEIKRRGGNAEILIPIGAGNFIRASIKDVNSVIVNIGANVSIEKGIEIAISDIEEKINELIKKSGLPVISVNNPLAEKYNIPIVVNDDYRGGYEVAKFLLNIGCKNLACIKGPKDSPSCEIRFEGFISGLKNMGYNTSNLSVVEGNLEFEGGYEGAKKILISYHKHIPDAIFCINDLMAIGAMKYITERGFKIPDNINVVGFDNIALSSQVVPPLTTVEMRRKEMGIIAAEKLIEFIEDKSKFYPLKIVLPCKLIIRSSTLNKK